MKKVKEILIILESLFLILSAVAFAAEIIVWGAFFHPNASFVFLFAAGLINLVSRLIILPDAITYEKNVKDKED